MQNLQNRKVLVMCIANPSKNPRPNRIINLLVKEGALVDTIAYKSNGDLYLHKEYNLRELATKKSERILRLLLKIIRGLIPFLSIKIKITERMIGLHTIKLDSNCYDLIIVENIEMLPMAIRNKNGAKILCDLREFYPLEYENSFLFRLLETNFKTSLCSHYLKKCHELITVSKGLIKGYKDYFDLVPKLIMSTPSYVEISPSDTQNNVIKMVHHGNANIDRKLENMIEIFKYLDERFYLDFYLVGNKKYIAQLKKIAKPYSKIRFLEPVAFKDIVKTINKYDIGLYLLEPTGFNTEYALPNKFFEYIQARLMLAIGPSPDMKELVERYHLGIVSDSFNPYELATKLNQLCMTDIIHYKKNTNLAARELSYQNESKKILALINELFIRRKS